MRFRRHFDTPETLGNFIFGAEANISARAEIHHVNGTKFEPPTLSWAEIRHLTRPLVAVFNFFFLSATSGLQSTNAEATLAAKYLGTEGFLHDGRH